MLPGGKSIVTTQKKVISKYLVCKPTWSHLAHQKKFLVSLMLQFNMEKCYCISQITVLDKESTLVSLIPNLAVELSMGLILSTCVNPIKISRIYAHI